MGFRGQVSGFRKGAVLLTPDPRHPTPVLPTPGPRHPTPGLPDTQPPAPDTGFSLAPSH